MWSRKYERCIDCGTTERRHHCGGRCKVCQSKHLRDTNFEYYKKQRACDKAWKASNHEKQALYEQKRRETLEAKRKAEYESRFPLPGQWAIEKEPDLFGRRIIGQVVNSRRDQEHYGEKMVVLELALTGHKVPMKLETLERYRGEVPQRIGAWELPEVDLNELLGVA